MGYYKNKEKNYFLQLLYTKTKTWLEYKMEVILYIPLFLSLSLLLYLHKTFVMYLYLKYSATLYFLSLQVTISYINAYFVLHVNCEQLFKIKHH